MRGGPRRLGCVGFACSARAWRLAAASRNFAHAIRFHARTHHHEFDGTVDYKWQSVIRRTDLTKCRESDVHYCLFGTVEE